MEKHAERADPPPPSVPNFPPYGGHLNPLGRDGGRLKKSARFEGPRPGNIHILAPYPAKDSLPAQLPMWLIGYFAGSFGESLAKWQFLTHDWP